MNLGFILIFSFYVDNLVNRILYRLIFEHCFCQGSENVPYLTQNRSVKFINY